MNEPTENDLRDIGRYISSQLNAPLSAMNMMRAIRESIIKLETAPLIHPIVRDDRLSVVGYRFFVIKNYIIFYIVSEKEKTVSIDRILYGRRDWMNIL